MDMELIQHWGSPRSTVAKAYGMEMRALTHDIEDCFERFLHRVSCKEGASRFYLAVHTLRTVPRSMRFTQKIKKLKKHLQNASNRVFNSPAQSLIPTVTQALTTPADTESPIGIAKATETIVGLLKKPNQQSLISIVGLGGSGKTTLARAVYCIFEKDNKIPCAWVSLSSLENQSAAGILSDLKRQLVPGGALREYLKKQNRYLIVLDGLKMKHLEEWDPLRVTFKGCGGLMVTTTIQSVASTVIGHCSEETSKQANGVRAFGYVYNMRRLGKEDSQELALQGRYAPEILHGSRLLLEKCDGHPLALASVANQLRCQDEPTGQFCMELSSSLGSYLEWDNSDEPNFTRLRSVLFDLYAGLPDHFVRTCMLYLSVFPANHLLRRNAIIRRWCAEGYAQNHSGGDLKVADDIFKLLVDKCVIWPVAPSRNSVVKACRIHGILHTFLMHKSASENFIKVFDEETHGIVRHLVVYPSDKMHLRSTCKLDLSRTRSLTVFGNGEAVISNFLEYKLVRVLDLEECTDLKNHHMEDICKLWNLRYLSLGPNITIIPKEIANLKLLQTFDISKTKVNELPLVIIGLPYLTHLVGKFSLEKPLDTDTISKFEQLAAECSLETVSGFVADGTPGFLKFMAHMKRLKKIKIWCSYADGSDIHLNNQLSTVIPQFLRNPIPGGGTRCLLLDFQAVPQGEMYAFYNISNFRPLQDNNFLSTPRKYIFLNTLKLRGEMLTLPPFVPKLGGLTELCLTLPQMTQNVMVELCKLENLLYLKVRAGQMDHSIIYVGHLRVCAGCGLW